MRPAWLLALCVGCTPSLTLPDAVTVRCGSNNDCTAGKCVANVCTVSTDTTAPRLVNAHAQSDTVVVISFDEPMDPASTTELTAYAAQPALSFTQANLSDDGASVLLTIASGLGHDVHYVLTVERASDIAGNVIDPSANSTSLASFFGVASGQTPVAVAPLGNARAPHLTTTLTWLTVADAETYTIDIAADATFATLAVPSIIVPGTSNSTTVTVPSAIPYTWRVRADVSPPGAYGQGSFDAIDATLHVYCPHDEECTPNIGIQTGNMAHPLRSIQAAVVLAQGIGVTSVAVANRGNASAAYQENVRIRDVAVSLLGGFDSSFATRDPIATPTIIEAYDSIVRIDDVAGVTLDGLTINSAAQASTPIGIQIDACSGTVTLLSINLNVQGAAAAIGVAASGTAAGCQLNATAVSAIAAGATAVGMSFETIGATLTTCTIEVTGSQTADGLVIATAAGLDIGDSTFTVSGLLAVAVNLQSSVTGATTSVHDSDVTSSQRALQGNYTLIENNRLIATGGAVTAGLFRIAEGFTQVFRNNIVIADAVGVNGASTLVGNTIVAHVPIQTGIIVTDNLFVSDGFECLQFLPPNISPTDIFSLQNNAFANCPSLFYSAATSINTLPDLMALDGTATTYGQHMHVSDNIVTGQDATALFVDAAHGDYHLTGSALTTIGRSGKAPNATDCGSAETQETCGGTLADFYGATRTAPYSMGAAEAD